ncbi:50S ribosomal protein L6 [Candidatus Micrarchaeota archaeon]|nr:50S ribosomal protein L6 [Candidatus Micrarchaeota archaeon]
MEVKIPEKTTVEIAVDSLKIKSGSHETTLKFNSRKMKIEIKDGTIHIAPLKKLRRETNAMINSVGRNIMNVFKGAAEPFSKKLQVVYAHFPVSIEIKGPKVIIKNFLGEKVPREANIVGKTQVVISGQDISVKGDSKEDVGQTAANIIQAVKIVGKDRRVFSDGIYHVR